jgi:AraC family transcriptional regulator
MSRSEGECHAVCFSLKALWRERLLEQGGPESFAELQPVPPTQTALALALAITSEVESGAASGALYAESLSLALLRYVVERSPVSNMRVRGALSDAQRRRIACYIEEHLCDDLSLCDLAVLTGLQVRHFSTLFRRAFGLPPHRYLIERRLARAALLLSTSRAEIVEVALQLGFASQSHFTVAFRKRYGVSPRRYALSRRSSTAGS